MPHAHVGTELVYATDRADLEPPFKVRYLGVRRGCWGKGKRSLVDVMLWGGIHPLALFYFLLGYTTRLLGNLGESKGPPPKAMFQGAMVPFNSHDTIPMAPEKSSWIGRFVSGEDKAFRGSYVNVVSNR